MACNVARPDATVQTSAIPGEFTVPLYDYACRQCGREFEVLVRTGHGSELRCPDCQATDVERLLSNFAVSSAATRKASFGKAKEQSLRVARDKRISEEEAIHHHHDHDH
jgi:putative FmdB family regulatory protein